MSDFSHTRIIEKGGRPSAIEFTRCALRVVSGPDAGAEVPLEQSLLRVGTSPACELVLKDPAVSRHHCEIEVDEHGFLLRDAGSTNGVFVQGLMARAIYLEPGTRFSIGTTTIELAPTDEERVEIRLSANDSFGSAIGSSVKMRELFFVLEKMSGKDVTILLTGETGTGKEVFARSIHEESPRREEAFVTVDCGSLPQNLVESELFGHVKGAFTGATSDRAGAFAEADGGTIFLDEIGELPLEQQAKLLRVLESREIKRVGEDAPRAVNVRVLAATNRSLPEEVEAGRFRKDLYYRLSVAEIRIPPLRERTGDIPLLAEQILAQQRGSAAGRPRLSAGALAALASHPWPGNVRELRNVLERAVALSGSVDLETAVIALGSVGNRTGAPGASPVDASVPWPVAYDRFEREYLMALLRAHDMNVSAAARAGGIHRATIHRLLRKHGIRVEELRGAD